MRQFKVMGLAPIAKTGSGLVAPAGEGSMGDDDAKDEDVSQISKAIEEKLSPRTEYATVGELSNVLQSLLSLSAATSRLAVICRRYIGTDGYSRDDDVKAIDEVRAAIDHAQRQNYKVLEDMILTRYFRQNDDSAE